MIKNIVFDFDGIIADLSLYIAVQGFFKMVPSETMFVDDEHSNIYIGVKPGFHIFQPKNISDWREKLTQLLKSPS